MSKKSLNISISGGTSAIGSVSQGDQATVHGTAEITQESVDRHFVIAEKTINDLAREFEKDKEQIQAAISQLSALKTEVQSGSKDTNKASGILKAVRENFSWAYPAIKDFAKAVWPAILVAIGT
jgi:hypothetical protein